MLLATVRWVNVRIDRHAIRWAGLMVALVVAFCLSTPAAMAQCTSLAGTVSTWTDGNSNWNNGGNWSGGTPNSSTSACINDGTSTVTLDASQSLSVKDLGIANGNTLTFGPNMGFYV